jgi:nuclear pore complex protein Nup133
LFEQGSGVKEIPPSEVFGAATDELDHRFTGLDASIRETIMKDMQVEDDALQPYIDTCRLGEWCKTAFALAKQDYDDEMAEKTNAGKMMGEAEQKLDEIEKSIGEKEKSRAESLLHSKIRFKPMSKANGSTGFRASFRQH